MIKNIALLSTIFLCSFALNNPSEEELVFDYIEKHKDLAVIEMYRSGIPASITLAQALHESAVGKSRLATQANNHFGIKCKSYWKGKKYSHKDDDFDAKGNLINSCFRAYDSVIESYVDHSNFLMNTAHYQELFTYERSDYKSWAHGLKKCGYATDKKYAYKLINKIEKFQLHIYDEYANPLELAVRNFE